MTNGNSPQQTADNHPYTASTVIQKHITEITIKLPQPNFPVEVTDNQQTPAKQVKFDTVVDDGKTKTKKTDVKGVFRVYTPVSKLKLTLTSDLKHQSQRRKPRKASGNHVLTPVDVKS